MNGVGEWGLEQTTNIYYMTIVYNAIIHHRKSIH